MGGLSFPGPHCGQAAGGSASMGQGTSNGFGKAGGKGPLGNEHSRRGGWLGKEGTWWPRAKVGTAGQRPNLDRTELIPMPHTAGDGS